MNKSLLNIFEESNKEVYEVTQAEWVNIMKDHHVNSCGRSLEEFKKYTETEIKCFHKQQVERALKNNKNIPEIVLKDYPNLKEQAKRELEKEKAREEYLNSIPIFTKEILNKITQNDKLKIDGYKCTVCSKDNNTLKARIYKKKKKGFIIIVGEKHNIEYGWS